MKPKKLREPKPRTLHAAPSVTTTSGTPTIVQIVYRHVRADGVAGADVTIQAFLADDTDASFLKAAQQIRTRRDQLQLMNDKDFTAATTPNQ